MPVEGLCDRQAQYHRTLLHRSEIRALGIRQLRDGAEMAEHNAAERSGDEPDAEGGERQQDAGDALASAARRGVIAG